MIDPRGVHGSFAYRLAEHAGATLPGLRRLDLRGNAGVSGLALCVAQQTDLTALLLVNTASDGTAVAALQVCLAPLTALRELDLSRNPLGSQGAAAALCVAPGLCSLASLSLCDTALRADDAAQLGASLAALGTLRSVDLSANSALEDAGIAALAHSMVQLSEPTALNLSDVGMQRAGAVALGRALSGLPQLRCLDVSGNTHMRDAGCAALVQHLAAPAALTALRLAAVGTGGQGDSALARTLAEMQTLQHLDVSGNWALGDAGIITLAQALTALSQLTELDVQDCGVQRAGAHALAARVGGMRSLRALRCTGGHSAEVGDVLRTIGGKALRDLTAPPLRVI